MNIKQAVALNLSADGIPPRLHMVQGDSNSRTIVATLWDGAQLYSVPQGSSLMVRFRKPDGTGGLYDTAEGGDFIAFSGATVTAPVAAQMLTVAGPVLAELDIYGGGSTAAKAQRIATFRFVIDVAASVYPDAKMISSDYYNVLTAKIAEALGAADSASDAAAAAASSAAAAAQSAADAAAAVEGAVKYNAAQGLTAAQQGQARENIGAASEAATTAALAGKQPTLTPGQNIVISGNVIGTKAFPCNPNLLDNWYFGNAVNQRGFTEAVSNGSYTIDRWKFVAGSTQKLAYAKGAGLSFIVEGGSSNVWTQIVEKLELSLLGRVVTGSLLLSDGTLLTQSGLVGETGFSVGDTSDVYCWVETDAFNIVSKRIGTTTAVAVKLELGSAQTLAHQGADGNWVLNEIPDYGMELLKCQRYFWRFAPVQYYAMATAFGISTNTARALIYLPTTMRAYPVCEASSGLFLSGASGDIFDLSLSPVWITPCTACVDFSKTAAFSENAVYFVRGGMAGSIDISADL